MLAEQRQLPRKILRGKAMLVMDGAAPVAARSLDIASNGMSISVESMIKAGNKGQVTFEMYFDGKSHILTSKVSITYCIFSGDEFKVGLQFLTMDSASLAIVTKYIR